MNDASTTTMQRDDVAAGNDTFSPIWAVSGGSKAIGLSYRTIGIVQWLSSGGGDKEGSQNIGGIELIFGVGGLFLTFFAAFIGTVGSGSLIG